MTFADDQKTDNTTFQYPAAPSAPPAQPSVWSPNSGPTSWTPPPPDATLPYPAYSNHYDVRMNAPVNPYAPPQYYSAPAPAPSDYSPYTTAPFYGQPGMAPPHNYHHGEYGAGPSPAPFPQAPPTAQTEEPSRIPPPSQTAATIPDPKTDRSLREVGFTQNGETYSTTFRSIIGGIFFLLGSIFFFTGLATFVFTQCARYCIFIFNGAMDWSDISYELLIWSWPLIFSLVGGIFMIVSFFSRQTTFEIDLSSRVVRVFTRGMILPCLFRSRRVTPFQDIADVYAEFIPNVRINRQSAGKLRLKLRNGTVMMTSGPMMIYTRAQLIATILRPIIAPGSSPD